MVTDKQLYRVALHVQDAEDRLQLMRDRRDNLIRQAAAEGQSHVHVARQVGLTKAMVGRIVHRRKP